MEKEALYPFGYGLSYSAFDLSDAKLSSEKITDTLTVTCTLHNQGDFEAAQTVQVYVKANRPGTPNPQLKGLKKITLPAGASAEINIELAKEAFSLVDEQGVRKVLPGTYSVFVGMSQPDSRSCELMGRTPAAFQVTID